MFLLRMKWNLGKVIFFYKRNFKNNMSRTTTPTFLVTDVFNIETRWGPICWFQVHSSTNRSYFYEFIHFEAPSRAPNSWYQCKFIKLWMFYNITNTSPQVFKSRRLMSKSHFSGPQNTGIIMCCILLYSVYRVVHILL